VSYFHHTMGESKLDHALDLMRRLPPSQIEDNLAGLLDLAPDLIEDLLSAVDQPLKIAFDPVSKRDYLLCDYNRDADSYRYLNCSILPIIYFSLSSLVSITYQTFLLHISTHSIL
jgi:capping protein beta